MSLIPSHILDKMSKADRDEYAFRHGLGPVAVMNTKELTEHCSAQAEKALQKDILKFLTLLGIPVGVPRMDKPSTMPVGHPDMTFPYRGYYVALECKTLTGKPTKEQNAWGEAITRQGGTWRIIRSVNEVKDLLREIDALDNPKPIIK